MTLDWKRDGIPAQRFSNVAVTPDVGLKSFETAPMVIGGIELAEEIKKGQFK